jgi:hypothetical protein
MEACGNWGLTHDRLEEIARIKKVVLAHPLKTRLVANAQTIFTGICAGPGICSTNAFRAKSRALRVGRQGPELAKNYRPV